MGSICSQTAWASRWGGEGLLEVSVGGAGQVAPQRLHR